MSYPVEALSKSRGEVKTWGDVNPFVLKRILPLVQGVVLDAGCAKGSYVQSLAVKGISAFGCDLFSWSEWQQKIPGIGVQSDLLCLPFPDKSFDTVISFNVLEHVPDIVGALAEIKRVCQGHFILSVPNCRYFPEMGKAGLVFHHWIDHSHVHFWEKELLQKLLIDQGFRIVFIEEFGTVRPEVLVLRSLGFPLVLARGFARVLQMVPWRKPYAPLLLAAVAII